MKKISAADAIHILSKNGAECLIAADTLGYLIESGMKVDCYVDDTSVIFADRSEEKHLITVIPLKSSFDCNALRNIICDNVNSEVWVDIQKLSKNFLSSFELKVKGFLKYERTVEDYIHQSQRPIEGVPDNIRLLDLDDRDCFIACSTESIENRPSLSMLFDIFIEKKEGFILGAFNEGHIVGYLSFFQMLPKVFDVDYIYVNTAQRGLGIGKSLGTAYAEYAQREKQTAYWSNAQNDASKATALACEFQIIRQSRKYMLNLLNE